MALGNVDADKTLRLLDYPSYFRLMDVSLPDNRRSILEKLSQEKLIVQEKARYNITNLGAILFANNLNDFETLCRKAVRVIIYKGKIGYRL